MVITCDQATHVSSYFRNTNRELHEGISKDFQLFFSSTYSQEKQQISIGKAIDTGKVEAVFHSELFF